MKRSHTSLQTSLSLFVIAGLFGFSIAMVKPILMPNYDASLIVGQMADPNEGSLEAGRPPLPWAELCYEHHIGSSLTRLEIDAMHTKVNECLDDLQWKCEQEDYGQATRNGRIESTDMLFTHWLNPFYHVFYVTVEESLTCDIHPANRSGQNSQGTMDEYDDPGSGYEGY
ncbi:MAG: hypothetical protein QF793_01080 [Candidatus Peribacteraceae bacterium]|jgi:hypothetical protein|nr:hypothetical protein [Candidatus Peribacteraceae bacterium]|tara:strand:+ start:27637 stop:28146 length:510 start_codon:yes stop_codon:yes gene_type:complete